MSDSPANDIETAIRRLADEVRNERVPERILALSRALQAALDALEENSDGSGEG
jgi:hypothetical protein